MAKTPTDIRSLARSHTEKAINVLVGIMQEPKAPQAARVAAAQALIDRGWGKATQVIDATVRNKSAQQMSDDELADIAAGSSEDTANAPDATQVTH